MIPSLYEIGYVVNFPEGDIGLYRTPVQFTGSISNTYHVISEGDTLLSIAQKYYGDQFLWYIIADANPSISFDMFELPVNTTILIPLKESLSLIYG